MTISIVTLGVTTPRIMTLSFTTFGMTDYFEHLNTFTSYAECRYAKCRYAECLGAHQLSNLYFSSPNLSAVTKLSLCHETLAG
jgi:hypothetical protein